MLCGRAEEAELSVGRVRYEGTLDFPADSDTSTGLECCSMDTRVIWEDKEDKASWSGRGMLILRLYLDKPHSTG